MEAVFLKLLNMGITASWLVLAVMVLRLLLKEAPKSFRCVLWAFVGIRLICPVSFESVFSLIPSSETVPPEILYARHPVIYSGVPSVDTIVNPVLSQRLASNVIQSVNPMQVLVFAGSVIWAVGIIGMAAYVLISYLRIRKRIQEAVELEGNIWLCDQIDTPFILGIIRPRIFLPSTVNERDIEYVTAHEYAHLKRRDHWWKPLAFLLLAVYWFHPILWIAYLLFCRDIELACDEKVLKEMGAEKKKPYANALICCSAPCGRYMGAPLAFGEIGIKSRVKAVLHYKKPGLWVLFLTGVLCIGAVVCFMTNPAGVQLRDADPKEKAEMVVMENKNRTYLVTSEPVLEEIIGFLNEIQVSRTAVSNDQSEDRDKTNIITVYHRGESEETYYFNQDCTEIWSYGEEGPSVSKKIDKPEQVRMFFSERMEALANRDKTEKTSAGTYVRYAYWDSPDMVQPNIILSLMEDHSCTFAYSAFSSYMPPIGKYELSDQTLTLTADNKEYTYVFDVVGDSYVFNASKSSKLPKYKYSGASSEPLSPVPDGAVFVSGTNNS